MIGIDRVTLTVQEGESIAVMGSSDLAKAHFSVFLVLLTVLQQENT